MNQQPTNQGRDSSLPVPGERPHFEATAGSRPVDFPEAGQASGWRSLLPWAFGLLTLFALVLVVLHFGTIEEFSRLAWAAALSGCFSLRRPSSDVCVYSSGGATGLAAGRAPTIARHARLPWCRQVIHRSGGPKRRRQRRDLGRTRPNASRSPDESRDGGVADGIGRLFRGLFGVCADQPRHPVAT